MVVVGLVDNGKDPNRGRRAVAEGTALGSPRLARRVLHLDDGHRVQVAVAGRGIPFVVVHGYSAEGFAYAQTLSRLVTGGFQVVAIDTAGHGGTAGLRTGGSDLTHYAELLGRVVDHLGIEKAIFAGHSMGGRLVTELAARSPQRVLGLITVDAIIGDTWDAMVQMFRVAPPLLAVTGTALTLDLMTTFPFARDPRQAVKLGRLWAPVWFNNARRPWNLVGPAVSILRSGSTRWMLERLADHDVAVAVVHGNHDVAVPLRTARDAARRSRGELVVVHGASHTWPLADPETFPALVTDLLSGRMGESVDAALVDAGVDPTTATVADFEAAFTTPGALVHRLTPEVQLDPSDVRRAAPRYRWTRSRPT